MRNIPFGKPITGPEEQQAISEVLASGHMVHGPQLFTYYRRKYGYREGDFPVAERLSRCSIALPVGPHVCEDDVEYMARCIRDLVQEVSS